MDPILSSEALKAVDQATMIREPISETDLMARAGERCAERIRTGLRNKEWGGATGCVVVVGWGNNGGDGLVIARSLLVSGIAVRVFRSGAEKASSAAFEYHLASALGAGVEVIEVAETNVDEGFAAQVVIVDCLFGRSSRAGVQGECLRMIDAMNRSGRPIVAIDAPSGVGPEREASDNTDCIHATTTLVLEVPRLEMFLLETGPCFGRWELIPIGLDPQALRSSPQEAEWIGKGDVQDLLRVRPRFGHKGTFGHAGLIVGSSGLFGAAVLATKGALRSGVGLVTTQVPAQVEGMLVATAPDAMTHADPDPCMITTLMDLERFTTVGIGPGLGRSDRSKSILDQLLSMASVPVVLDADALTMISADTDRLRSVRNSLVLTPHPGEMDRLLGSPSRNGRIRLERTRDFAVEYGCTVVLKGAYTAICGPDGIIRFNSTGNDGLAKGGSGDVLTGLLTGILAQGYTALEACLIAVYLHGSAGDLAAGSLGKDAMRPSDVLEFLPNAWQLLREASE